VAATMLDRRKILTGGLLNTGADWILEVKRRVHFLSGAGIPVDFLSTVDNLSLFASHCAIHNRRMDHGASTIERWAGVMARDDRKRRMVESCPDERDVLFCRPCESQEWKNGVRF